MSKIPTAKEFLISWTGVDNSTHPDEKIRDNFIQNQNQLIEFAKLHVEACKKEISEKAQTECDEGGETGFVNKDSILNAYPLENIK